MMLSRLVAALAIGFAASALGGAATAGSFEDGQAAYARGDYQGAVDQWRPLAEQGDARSEEMLGLAYHTGRGVPRDYAAAAVWYHRAAAQGEVQAQKDLGEMYANGEGVPQNYAEAIKWWSLAVD